MPRQLATLSLLFAVLLSTVACQAEPVRASLDPWTYDANSDRRIDRDEALSATLDYIADVVSKSDARQVVDLYLSGAQLPQPTATTTRAPIPTPTAVPAPTPTSTPTPVKSRDIAVGYMTNQQAYLILNDVSDFTFSMDVKMPHDIPKDYYAMPASDSQCARSHLHGDDWMCKWGSSAPNVVSEGTLGLNMWFRQSGSFHEGYGKWRPGTGNGTFIQILGPECRPQFRREEMGYQGWHYRHTGWSCRVGVSTWDNNIALEYHDFHTLFNSEAGDFHRIELVVNGDTGTLSIGGEQVELAIHRQSMNSSDLVIMPNGSDITAHNIRAMALP